jgi:hypothetical protein
MDQQTRMFKTLGCLVGAMTGTAALLGWIDPSEPLPPEPPSFDAILRDAQSLVADDVALHKDRWHAVKILAGAAMRDSPTFLTATADRSACHFLIDDAGRTSRTAQWLRQEASHSDPGTVRSQVACLQALIAAVRNVVATESATLPVRLHEEWAKAYGLEPGATLAIPPTASSVG